jgi:hypothetical protein
VLGRLQERQPRHQLTHDQRSRHRREQGQQLQRHRLCPQRAIDDLGELSLHRELDALPRAEPPQLRQEGLGVARAPVETHHQQVAALAKGAEVGAYRVERRRRVDQVATGALDLRRELAR